MNGALPEIRVEAYDKIDQWRVKLDETEKKSATYSSAPPPIYSWRRNMSAISARSRP